jgi:hypothetical protein
MSKPIQEALVIVKDAKLQINKLLSGPQHNQNLLEINAHFNRIENRLGFMGAILEPNDAKNGKTRFPPMTSFMGQQLDTVKKFDKNDLTADETTKKKYLARLEKLWNEIGNLTPDHLLKSYRIEADIIVLRGVANRAGIKDFETAELNNQFIGRVQEAVAAKKNETTTQAKIDKSVKGNDSKNKSEEKTKEPAKGTV